MTEKMKDSLAIVNGLTEERYIEKIRKGVEEEYPNKADEIAHLRKEIDYLRSIIELILPAVGLTIDFADDEYIEYTSNIEKVKENAKKDLKI